MENGVREEFEIIELLPILKHLRYNSEHLSAIKRHSNSFPTYFAKWGKGRRQKSGSVVWCEPQAVVVKLPLLLGNIVFA